MFPFVYISGLKYSSWSVFLFIGFLLPYLLIVIMRPKGFCMSRFQIAVVFLSFFILALMGAKLVHILLYAHKYIGRPFNVVWDAAGASYPGALLFAMIGIYIYARETKRSFLEIVDYLAPFAMLERVLGRIGCFMAGCCHGYPSLLPWAVVFRLGGDAARHPTQAYELIYSLSIFITALVFYPTLRGKKGGIFSLTFFTYGFMRFLNETLRPDSPFVIWPIKLSHLGMIALMVLTAVIFKVAVLRHGKPNNILALLKRIALTYIVILAVASVSILSLLTSLPLR